MWVSLRSDVTLRSREEISIKRRVLAVSLGAMFDRLG
jgi:hypothetical protein